MESVGKNRKSGVGSTVKESLRKRLVWWGDLDSVYEEVSRECCVRLMT